MWLLILACATQDPGPPGCNDLEDPSAAILEAWALDETDAIAQVRDCDSPQVQVVLVETLVESHPGQTRALCEVLPPGSVRERCVQLNSRPHLWEETPPIRPVGGRPGGGPSSLRAGPQVTASTLDVVSVDSACAAEGAQSTCLSEEARAHARGGRAAHALAVCRLEADLQWANECLFEAAEARQESEAGSTDARYLEATELCLEAGDYRTFCLGHLHLQMARSAPPADAPHLGAWEEHLERGERIGRVWRDRGEEAYGRLARAYYWSELLWESISRARRVVGNPRDFLPVEAEPHLRAAASYRLMSEHALTGQTLEQAVDTVARRLEERSTDTMVLTGPAPVRAEGNLWPEDRPDDEAVPAQFYLGVSRRAVDPDLRVDLTICVLEAAARQSPLRMDLLEQGRTHAHPRVRWTAERLTP